MSNCTLHESNRQVSCKVSCIIDVIINEVADFKPLEKNAYDEAWRNNDFIYDFIFK